MDIEELNELQKSKLNAPAVSCSVVHCKKENYDVYIGRPSKWGNPFTHIKDGKTLAKYTVGSRDEAVEAYREWITNGDGKHLMNDLHELKGKVMGCWCKPKSCHGDVLSELVSKLTAVTWEAVEMIAFRDRDIDNDIWCENAFLFKTREDVKRFFTADNPVLLDNYTEDGNRVLNDFEIHKNNPAGHITSVSFRTEYAGEVRLYEMSAGWVCSCR